MNSENTLSISLQEVCTARWSKMRQELKTDPEYESIIPKLTDEEFKQLEENLLADGVLAPLIVWNGTIVDGHNRYRIAQKHCRLRCINTALHEYRKVGEKCYKEAMRIIIQAWRGKPASLLSEVVKTICTFAKIYDGEYYPKKLAEALSHTDPYEIVKVYLQIGKRGGIKNSLKFVLDCYNANAPAQSLPMKF